MSGLTLAIGKLGSRLTARRLQRAQRALLAATLLLGLYWLLA